MIADRQMVGYFLIETDPEILRRFLMSLIGSAIFFFILRIPFYAM